MSSNSMNATQADRANPTACPMMPGDQKAAPRILLHDPDHVLQIEFSQCLPDHAIFRVAKFGQIAAALDDAIADELPYPVLIFVSDCNARMMVEQLSNFRRIDREVQFLVLGAASEHCSILATEANLAESTICVTPSISEGALRQLVASLISKWQLRRQMTEMSDQLEKLVAGRTADLERAHVDLVAFNRKLESAKAAAEEANQAKSAFLATMSHEIRTPMTAILGYADYLLEEGDLQQAPRQRIEAINTIVRNGRHLVQLINDILDLSKIEANRLETERVACHPLAVAMDVVSLMRARAEEKQLQLSIGIDGAIPETIYSDPTRIRQILVNLLGNAVKFTEQGSVALLLRLKEHPASFLQFEVRDSGIGMDASQMAKLFEPFTQVDSSMTRRYGGTGLGLCICKRLTEMLGGTITVESQPNIGSTFLFEIATGPFDRTKMLTVDAALFHQRPDPVAEAQARQVHCNITGRILLAEDGPDNQRLIAHILRKAGAEVTVVENGQLAIERVLSEAAAGNGFDLVLMDMQMPVLDGYAATRQLRDHGVTTPLIALTAFAMTGDRERCVESGCTDYLTKPLDRKQLLSVVSHHLATVKASNQNQVMAVTLDDRAGHSAFQSTH